MSGVSTEAAETVIGKVSEAGTPVKGMVCPAPAGPNGKTTSGPVDALGRPGR